MNNKREKKIDSLLTVSVKLEIERRSKRLGALGDDFSQREMPRVSYTF